MRFTLDIHDLCRVNCTNQRHQTFNLFRYSFYDPKPAKPHRIQFWHHVDISNFTCYSERKSVFWHFTTQQARQVSSSITGAFLPSFYFVFTGLFTLLWHFVLRLRLLIKLTYSKVKKTSLRYRACVCRILSAAFWQRCADVVCSWVSGCSGRF